jgi:hypothetical protein
MTSILNVGAFESPEFAHVGDDDEIVHILVVFDGWL